MSIATRTGDDGNTGLFGGGRVAKDDPRVAAYGDVDELNSHLGVVRSEALTSDVDALVARIQSELFDLGAELATRREGNPHASKVPAFSQLALDALDRDLATFEARVKPMTAFILPGGHRIAALLHVARTTFRRAERSVVALARHERISSLAIRYLNRLSDLLFVLARFENASRGVGEPEWHAKRPETA